MFARSVFYTLGGFALVVTLCAVPAQAQVPSTVNPARMLDRADTTPTITPNVDLTIIEGGEETTVPAGSDKKIFVLRDVVLEGSSVYGEEGLKQTYEDHIGKEVSFADLQRIAQAMTAQYRSDGYILSRVVLQTQKIRDGIVHFQAIEGYVDQIQINGDVKDKELIDAYASKIKLSRPLNSKSMERYLLLMDDLPGVTARSVLKASATQKGASDLIINLEDKWFEGALQADNRGNKFIGPYQFQGVAAFNSTMRAYDRNTLRVLTSSDFEELLFVDYSNEQQLGTEGMRLTSRLAAARTQPGSTLAPLDLEGTTQLFEIELRYPVLRSREENFVLATEFAAQNSDNESAGVELFDDQVRHIALGADYDLLDNWDGINKLSVSATQGLDILGATEDGANRSRVTGKHEFTRFNAAATRIQDITNNVSLYGSVNGQYSLDPLLVSEQFAIGGEAYGRAYDSAELLGDHGVAGILELRYHGVPDDQSFVNSYQPYVFYDIGTAWLEEPAVGESDSTSISSAGLGTRVNFLDDYAGYVELSFPLNRDVASEGDRGARVFFNIIRRFDAN